MRLLLWRKWVRILALILVPACMAVVIVRWAFLLPAYIGVPLEQLVYYPAKLPSLLIATVSRRSIIGNEREIIIAAVWAIISLGIYRWHKSRKHVIRQHDVNSQEGIERQLECKKRPVRVWGRPLAILLLVFVVVAVWAGEGLGIIPSYPGPGLANISCMTGLSLPGSTRLLFSHFGGGLQDRPVHSEFEIDTRQIPRLLRSLPPSFTVIHASMPPISYSDINAKPEYLSWSVRDGGEGIVAERANRDDKYAQVVVITHSKQNTVSRVYIFYFI